MMIDIYDCYSFQDATIKMGHNTHKFLFLSYIFVIFFFLFPYEISCSNTMGIFASQGLRPALLIFETEMSRADRNPWLAKMSYMIQLSNNYNIGYINNTAIKLPICSNSH